MTEKTEKYAGAMKSAQVRSERVRNSVLQAMATIRKEMDDNNGIYPANGGAISLNEVARRAGIGATTFFVPKQAELRKEVQEWLDAIKKREVVGRVKVRRALAERVDDWKRMYEQLQSNFILLELELQDAQVQIEAVTQERDRLAEELRRRPSNVSLLPIRKPVNQEDR